MLPQRQGKMVVLPKGQKPGGSMGQPQGGYQGGYQQNYNQGGPQQIGNGMHGDPADPGNSGQGYR